jgi:hypothetical protein
MDRTEEIARPNTMLDDTERMSRETRSTGG